MKIRKIALSLVLFGAGCWCTLLVQRVMREIRQHMVVVSDITTLALYAPKEQFQRAIEGQPQLDVYNYYGESPLVAVIDIGNTERVKMLLDKGAGVEFPDGNGMTPLCCAAMNGYEDIVKILLDRGADPNRYSPRGYPPLISAYDNNRYEVARLLISRGADIRKKPTRGSSIEKMCANELVSEELRQLRIQAMKALATDHK